MTQFAHLSSPHSCQQINNSVKCHLWFWSSDVLNVLNGCSGKKLVCIWGSADCGRNQRARRGVDPIAACADRDGRRAQRGVVQLLMFAVEASAGKVRGDMVGIWFGYQHSMSSMSMSMSPPSSWSFVPSARAAVASLRCCVLGFFWFIAMSMPFSRLEVFCTSEP